MQREWRSSGSSLQKANIQRRNREPLLEQTAAKKEDGKGLILAERRSRAGWSLCFPPPEQTPERLPQRQRQAQQDLLHRSIFGRQLKVWVLFYGSNNSTARDECLCMLRVWMLWKWGWGLLSLVLWSVPPCWSASLQAAAEFTEHQRQRGLYTLSCDFEHILAVISSVDDKVMLTKYLRSNIWALQRQCFFFHILFWFWFSLRFILNVNS